MQSPGNDQTTWNLKPLFSSDTDPAIQINLSDTETAVNDFVNKWKSRSDYLSEAKVLKEALDDLENLYHRYGVSGKVEFYFHLRFATNQNNSDLKAQLTKVDDFAKAQVNKLQFFELNLGKISSDQQSKFLTARELEEYRHYLERLFVQAKHLLTEPEEKIMVLKSGPSHERWTRMTTSFLAKELRHGQNLSQLISNMASPNKSKRDKAAKYATEILSKYAEVAENEMNAILENKKINDMLRGYERPDSSRHLADDIDTSVVDAMTSAVTSRFDLSQDFYQLKAKFLGVTQLKYWERGVPYGKTNKKYSFTKSIDLISKVFANLDPEFAQILERYVSAGQLDVYSRSGKEGGAFCAYWLINAPTFVMLNHNDRLQDVLTIAHEMGHAINSELMRSQNALNYGSPLSMAEVASTFMEDFVLQELLRDAKPELKKTLLVQKMDDDVSTIIRQVAAYNFEKELHAQYREKGYLDAKAIGEIMRKHMSAYMGPAVEQSEGSENYWVYWSHFRNFFYVYSYASGLLISKALQAKVKQDPKFIKQVKQILAAGSSDSPKNIFQKYAGIDISDPKFWLSGLKEVESLLEEVKR